MEKFGEMSRLCALVLLRINYHDGGDLLVEGGTDSEESVDDRWFLVWFGLVVTLAAAIFRGS